MTQKQFSNAFAKVLKVYFPALGTRRDMPGADVVDDLVSLYDDAKLGRQLGGSPPDDSPSRKPLPELYELTSENITYAAGGPMGSSSTTNFQRYFRSADKAKIAAQKDIGRSPIKWQKSRKGWTSGDMGHVMYTIIPVKIED